MRQIFKEAEKIRQDWHKKRRIGNVKYDPVRSKIIFIGENGFEYEITLDRLKTAEDAMKWICHMSEKNWVTPQMIYDFIKVIKRVTNCNFYCNPEFWE
jgi:hypothetical protein